MVVKNDGYAIKNILNKRIIKTCRAVESAESIYDANKLEQRSLRLTLLIHQITEKIRCRMV